jgi:hypothetical protein
MSFYLKDPLSRVDYAIDWAPGYLVGRTITESAWSVTPTESGGIALDGASFAPARAVTTLIGGVAGHVYSVINRVTLSDGRIDRRSVTLRVEAR